MPHPPTTRAINLIAGHPLATRTLGADFTERLESGVTIASATLTQENDTAGATELTLGSPVVNTSTFTNNQRATTVAIGKGVQFTVTGGDYGVTYLITVSATLTPGGEVEPLGCIYKIDDDL